MPKKDSLASLIADIGKMSTQQSMNRTLDYQIDGIIVSVLKEMGIKTIVDTGQARSIFVELANRFGRDISEILDVEYYEYWGNEDRNIYEGEQSNILISEGKGRFVSIDIKDDGLVAQEEYSGGYPKYPSEVHPRSESYESQHLTKTVEMAMSGNLVEFEMQLDLAIEKIIRILEGV